jgi:GT2 family glycosyltransferase
MTWGCVVLTMGTRPELLREGLGSLLGQRDVETDVVVVGNAWNPTGLPEGVRGVHLPENRWASGGRNAGVPHVRGELLFFLDDDAVVAQDDALARLEAMFEAEPDLGMVQLAVEPREPGGARSREWVPRLRVGDPRRSSEITSVWEGAVAMRRVAFDASGGWPEELEIVHEGIDLGWRVMDAGYRIRYAGDLVARHPSPTGPRRLSHYFAARNRVFVARRNLPLPLALLYVSMFALRTLPRLKSRRAVQEAARGYRDGLRRPCGTRRALRPRTLARMTRAGRPPII